MYRVIGTVHLTVTATNTGIVYENLAIGRAMDGIWRTIFHAVGMFAMSASNGYMDVGETFPPGTVET